MWIVDVIFYYSISWLSSVRRWIILNTEDEEWWWSAAAEAAARYPKISQQCIFVLDWLYNRFYPLFSSPYDDDEGTKMNRNLLTVKSSSSSTSSGHELSLSLSFSTFSRVHHSTVIHSEDYSIELLLIRWDIDREMAHILTESLWLSNILRHSWVEEDPRIVNLQSLDRSLKIALDHMNFTRSFIRNTFLGFSLSHPAINNLLSNGAFFPLYFWYKII